jgi:RNA polymerase sigma-70 factor (ECF subfamily)
VIGAAVAFRGFYVPAGERPDIVQDVTAQVWRALAAPGAAPPDDLEAFARAIAYRRCVDWVRRHRATEDVSDELVDGAPRPDRAVLDGERKRIGEHVLRSLRERCRELFQLHAGQGLTYREIAERQGRLEKTVRNQMSECLREARDLARGWGGSARSR